MKVKRKQKSSRNGTEFSATQLQRGRRRPRKNNAQEQNGATQVQGVERYLTLAREAEAAGDAVQSEYYYQYAEHHLRTAQKQS